APRQAIGGRIVAVFGRGPSDRRVELAFSTDGKTLAASFGGTHVRQFETASGRKSWPATAPTKSPLAGCTCRPAAAGSRGARRAARCAGGFSTRASRSGI